MRLPALIALLTPAVAITVSPARAAAEASWVDGPRVGYLNVPAPPPCPGSTQVMSMGVSYLTAEDGSGPEAGRIFDVRVLIDVAPDCAGLNAQLRIALPFDSVFYTQNGERIRCFERVGAGETVELPQSECAPTEPQDLGGRESGFILTRIDPPARMLRPLKAGTRHVIVIPVMILAPEGRADNSFAAEIVVDGPGSYGIGTFPHVWRAIVGFPVKPSPHEIRDPKVQMLTPTSIDLQARFYNGLRAGVASFRVEGEGRMLSSRVLSLETNNIWRDFTGNVQGLNPMTTYRWWAVMQTSSGTVETTPQTFTTPAGPPADPPMPDAGAPPPLPMPPDPSTSNPPGPSPGDSNPSVNPPPPAPEMTPPGPMAGGQQPAPPGGDSPGPRGETGVGQAESAGGCRVVANGQPKKGNPIALLIVLVGLATIAGRRRVFPPRCRGPGRRVRQAA